MHISCDLQTGIYFGAVLQGTYLFQTCCYFFLSWLYYSFIVLINWFLNNLLVTQKQHVLKTSSWFQIGRAVTATLQTHHAYSMLKRRGRHQCIFEISKSSKLFVKETLIARLEYFFQQWTIISLCSVFLVIHLFFNFVNTSLKDLCFDFITLMLYSPATHRRTCL